MRLLTGFGKSILCNTKSESTHTIWSFVINAWQGIWQWQKSCLYCTYHCSFLLWLTKLVICAFQKTHMHCENTVKAVLYRFGFENPVKPLYLSLASPTYTYTLDKHVEADHHLKCTWMSSRSWNHHHCFAALGLNIATMCLMSTGASHKSRDGVQFGHLYIRYRSSSKITKQTTFFSYQEVE